MNKKSLLFLLLMALFVPLAMNGQGTLTVCNGTVENRFIPFYAYSGDTQGTTSEFIIPESNLTALNGKSITALKFYLSQSQSKTWTAVYKVYMAEVATTQLTRTIGPDAGTVVYQGTVDASGSEMTITFNQGNYTYNGGHLLIGTYVATAGAWDSNGMFYGIAATSAAYLSGDWNGNETGAKDFIPKTTFTYLSDDPYITLAPADATVLTGFNETLTVTYGNVSGTPTITYTSSNNNVATVSGSGTTATVTGVSAGTATITATMNGSYTATSTITVENPSYCTPAPTSIDGSGMHPVNFGSGNYVVNNTTYPTSSPYYGDYSSQVGAYEAGETASVEMSFYTYGYSGYNYGAVIWVDWNKDYEFSDSEIVNKGTSTTPSSSSSPGTLTLSFTVPATAAAGDYRMRIGAADSYFDSFISGTASAAHDPCYTGGYTCFHDYTLRVLAGGAYHITCNATTNGTISVDHGSADAGETITVTAVPETNYELTALSYNDGSDHNISFSNNQGSFTMPAADVTVSATFSIMRNLPPYDLTVGTPGGHSVELGWTGVSTNTNHQGFDLYYSTDPVMPQTPVQSSFIGGITTSSYELTGLAPTTTYYAWVRDNCGTDGYSDWVAFTSFTTDVACPAPTNVAANHITNNSAVINWEGNAESYIVRYRTPQGFRYDFESATPWAVDDFSPCTTYDGDGGSTYAFQSWDFPNSGYTGACIAFNNDNESSSNMYAHGGVAFGVMFDIEGAQNDWFILPELTIENGDIFSFWAREITDQYGAEVINVGVCGSNHTFSAYLAQNLNISTTEWTLYSYDLSAYAGQTIQLAINSVSNDVFGFMFDDIFVGNPNDDTWDEVITDVTSPLTITGLTAETEYEVQVQANCGSEDGTSEWVSTTFTTLDNCALPYELNATNLTGATATLNWTGAQEAYNVRYRSYTLGEPQENVFEEGFEGGSMPSGWTRTGSYWKITSGTGSSSYTGSATGNYNAGCYISSYNGSDILITPSIDLSQATSATLTFNFWNTKWGSDINTLNVYYRVDGGAWSNALYTNSSEVTPWTSISVMLPSSGFAANYQIGFECVSNYSYGMGIDDVKITYTAQSVTPGEWLTKTNVTSPLNIDGLAMTTNYEWQVQGVDCDGNGGTTGWSDMATFTTPEGYVKHIVGYGTSQNGGYELIASPIGNVAPTSVTNMLSNSYDLYYFNQSGKQGENYLEWINYKPEAGQYQATDPEFDLVRGKGYLYANSQTVDLVFTGRALSTEDFDVTLSYDGDARLAGWNLVGNPYAEPAYFTTDRDFYTMNSAGTSFEVCDDPERSIEAMQGVFVVATSNNETLTFTTTQPTEQGRGIVLKLSEGRSNTDAAIVRFGEGLTLPKLQLFEGSTKIYIPQEGKEYAVVRSEEMGEMPVNFKAENNGTFSLNVSGQNTEFAYLHLIDNLTGNDVDLLETPSYSFAAKTTDYASRFKLVYATGNASDDSFAFYSNGSFVINNEGSAELQVVDVMGRILSSETINGCANVSVNAAPGVYMLRLVNGDNVKVQKVVVK